MYQHVTFFIGIHVEIPETDGASKTIVRITNSGFTAGGDADDLAFPFHVDDIAGKIGDFGVSRNVFIFKSAKRCRWIWLNETDRLGVDKGADTDNEQQSG
jgi:hypothetical protein